MMTLFAPPGLPAWACNRSTSANVRPPTAKAPTRKKSRRDTPSPHCCERPMKENMVQLLAVFRRDSERNQDQRDALLYFDASVSIKSWKRLGRPWLVRI